ncbi:Cwf15/Cwc15 cell cycle control protein [Microdochium nivale]|nr:Cwf15/Cwc15 cell cycle control protein [Microdochium nivale]
MTTAHRPTFDPARGKEALRGPAYHQRLAPAHTSLKFRQPGQGGAAGAKKRDLRAELLAAEAAHLAKRNGGALPATAEAGDNSSAAATKRPLATLTSQEGGGEVENEEEDFEAKRRRVLEESRDMDADSEDDSDDKGSGNDNDDDDSDDDSDDDDAELQRELEKIRRERAEKREKEERERLAAEEAEREKDIALGNPLLNNSMVKQDFNMKRRWDDDVVFKNQARGTEDKGKQKEFINDLLRSDFHKRFMGKYVR